MDFEGAARRPFSEVKKSLVRPRITVVSELGRSGNGLSPDQRKKAILDPRSTADSELGRSGNDPSPDQRKTAILDPRSTAESEPAKL
ncbi:hypothetical protein TNCV_4750411 [Trichonephila clavipes]|nr:hypothetical protein TNCV_4750411 [Trichonephila clavipes]